MVDWNKKKLTGTKIERPAIKLITVITRIRIAHRRLSKEASMVAPKNCAQLTLVNLKKNSLNSIYNSESVKQIVFPDKIINSKLIAFKVTYLVQNNNASRWICSCLISLTFWRIVLWQAAWIWCLSQEKCWIMLSAWKNGNNTWLVGIRVTSSWRRYSNWRNMSRKYLRTLLRKRSSTGSFWGWLA